MLCSLILPPIFLNFTLFIWIDLQLIALVTITGLLIFFLIIPAIYHPVLLRATVFLPQLSRSSSLALLADLHHHCFVHVCRYVHHMEQACLLSSSLIPRTPHIPILPDILYEYIPKVY